VDGFVDGLAAERCRVDRHQVEQAMCTHLAVRFVFSALLLDVPADTTPEERHARLERRARLARHGMDLAAQVLAG
jgi:hypothetical protein